LFHGVISATARVGPFRDKIGRSEKKFNVRYRRNGKLTWSNFGKLLAVLCNRLYAKVIVDVLNNRNLGPYVRSRKAYVTHADGLNKIVEMLCYYFGATSAAN